MAIRRFEEHEVRDLTMEEIDKEFDGHYVLVKKEGCKDPFGGILYAVSDNEDYENYGALLDMADNDGIFPCSVYHATTTKKYNY